MCDSKVHQGEMQESHYSLIVRVVSSVLDKLISGSGDSTKSVLSCGNEFMKFQSSYAPEVTIESYLERIRRYSRCSDACFVMSLIYVDRLIETKSLVLTSLNAHRLLITSVMLAAKFHDDLFYNNSYYSKLGGLSLTELNHLEADLLHLLDFSLFVKEAAYCKYSNQLQNYAFYVEVVPSPRSAQNAYFETQPSSFVTPTPVPEPVAVAVITPAQVRYLAQTQAATSHCPPLALALGAPALLQQSLRNVHMQSLDRLAAAAAPPRIPSPDNPHAKACSFSEHYLSANSPLHIAPASASASASASVSVNAAYPRLQQQQIALLQQAQAQVQAQVLQQAQQQAQHQAQQQAHLLAQRYTQNYFVREPATTTMPTRSRSPLDFQNGFEGASGSAEGSQYPMAASLGGYGPSYGPPAGVSLRDSGDESTTNCSTRAASPYPLYSRSTSSNMLVGGGGSGSGGGVSVGVGVGVSNGNGGALSLQMPQVSTPLMYPTVGPTWSVDSYAHNSRSPGGQSRVDLSIQTDSLGMGMGMGMDSYPMQRTDSGVSVTTPYSAMYAQSPTHLNNGQNQNNSLNHGNHVYHQHLVQYQQSCPAPSPLGAYPGAAAGSGSGHGSAAHTPNGHSHSHSHTNSYFPAVSQVHTPTDRRYSSSVYSFAPAPEVYGYGGQQHQQVEEYLQNQSHGQTHGQGYGQGQGHSYGSYHHAQPTHLHPQPNPSGLDQGRVSPFAHAAMLLATLGNNNSNHHHHLSDPLNFYGASAGQM